MRRIALVAAALTMLGAATSAAGAGAGPPSSADLVHLNEVQVVGSHNSYHLAATPEESALRRSVIGAEEDRLLYEHDPIETQLASQRVRQLELDVFVDTAGGRYATPLIRTATGQGAYDPVMLQPGLKVLHAQDVDYRSTCLTLVACLQAVERWSVANPAHLPVAVLVELKDGPLDLGIPTVVPEPFDAAALDDLDREIRSVFDEDHLLTPDDVRGGHDTLEEAVLTDGWPTVGEARGKVMFLMDNGGDKRELYRDGHPSLEGRPIFTNGVPGEADAAFVKVNEAIGNVDRIAELVEAGYVVRTRADVETIEARANDTTRRDAALASGAQWVSTDYPVPNHGYGFTSDYWVGIPGGTVARCNPVNGPAGCVSADLEPAVAPPPTGPTSGPTVGPTTPAPGGRPGPAPAATPIRARARFTG